MPKTISTSVNAPIYGDCDIPPVKEKYRLSLELPDDVSYSNKEAVAVSLELAATLKDIIRILERV